MRAAGRKARLLSLFTTAPSGSNAQFERCKSTGGETRRICGTRSQPIRWQPACSTVSAEEKRDGFRRPRSTAGSLRTAGRARPARSSPRLRTPPGGEAGSTFAAAAACRKVRAGATAGNSGAVAALGRRAASIGQALRPPHPVERQKARHRRPNLLPFASHPPPRERVSASSPFLFRFPRNPVPCSIRARVMRRRCRYNPRVCRL
jgi:hypothetical protein